MLTHSTEGLAPLDLDLLLIKIWSFQQIMINLTLENKSYYIDLCHHVFVLVLQLFTE